MTGQSYSRPDTLRVQRSKPLVLIGLYVLFSLASAGLAISPPDAIGSLYLVPSLRYLCTATAVSGSELGLQDTLVLLTAAHCVDEGLEQHATTEQWSSRLRYQVSFDSQTFFDVTPHRVGDKTAGLDLAILFFDQTLPEVTPLSMGNWESVDYGTSIQNFANPLGMGIQYFTGAVTMLEIKPSPAKKQPQWHYNAVASVQVGPGSSGSLILNDRHEYIGVLSSVMEAKFGSPFTVFIPQWRFEAFLTDDDLALTLPRTAARALPEDIMAQLVRW